MTTAMIIMKSVVRMFRRRFWTTNPYMALTIQIWCGTARLSNLRIAAIMKTTMRAQAARAVIMTATMIGIPGDSWDSGGSDWDSDW